MTLCLAQTRPEAEDLKQNDSGAVDIVIFCEPFFWICHDLSSQKVLFSQQCECL